MALTGVHADYAGNRHGNGECGYSPLSVRGATRCMCAGYPATTMHGQCTVCGAGYYETMEEYQADIPESGGFVETEDNDLFPVTVTVYLNTHGTNAGDKVCITNVRESSITIEDRKGIRTLVCESFVTERIAYVPFPIWYTTEVQTKVMDY